MSLSPLPVTDDFTEKYNVKQQKRFCNPDLFDLKVANKKRHKEYSDHAQNQSSSISLAPVSSIRNLQSVSIDISQIKHTESNSYLF